MANKVVMFDAGINYLKGGNAVYDFNGSTVLITGSYRFDDAARIYVHPVEHRCLLTTLSG